MSIYRRAARVDANQAAVIAALQAIGCVVEIIRQPVDLLVGFRGVWVPAEVKDGAKAPSARKLKPSQAKFLERCTVGRLQMLTLTGPEQAVREVMRVAEIQLGLMEVAA